jgi:hypothetical protein
MHPQPTLSREGALEKMSSTTKNILGTIACLVVGFILLRWVIHVALTVLWTVLPLALVGGAIYVGYQAFGRKALGGGRRTLP